MKSGLFKTSIVIALLFPFISMAQGNAEVFTAKNVVYAELGGNAGRYAINYQRLFFQKGYFKFAGSIGFSMFSHRYSNKIHWAPVLPIEVSGYFGRSKHHVEMGIGYTPYFNPTTTYHPVTMDLMKESYQLSAFMPVRIGYRYQRPGGGFFFRAGYTPFFQLPDKERKHLNFHYPFAGISLGKSF